MAIMNQAVAARQAAESQPRWTNRLAWLSLAALVAGQYGLFLRAAARDVTWFVPTGFDQCLYLSKSYEVAEQLEVRGLVGGLAFGVEQPVPTGTLFHLVGGLLCQVFGPSRLAVLTINFALYAAFQCALA